MKVTDGNYVQFYGYSIIGNNCVIIGIAGNHLSTLKNESFANSVIFAIFDFLDFWVSCHFGFLLLCYHFAKFTKPTLILRNFGFCLKPRLINITRLNPVQK